MELNVAYCLAGIHLSQQIFENFFIEAFRNSLNFCFSCTSVSFRKLHEKKSVGDKSGFLSYPSIYSNESISGKWLQNGHHLFLCMARCSIVQHKNSIWETSGFAGRQWRPLSRFVLILEFLDLKQMGLWKYSVPHLRFAGSGRGGAACGGIKN